MLHGDRPPSLDEGDITGTCLTDALHKLRNTANPPMPIEPPTGKGPFRILSDGNEMLRPFGLALQLWNQNEMSTGSYVTWCGFHFEAVRVYNHMHSRISTSPISMYITAADLLQSFQGGSAYTNPIVLVFKLVPLNEWDGDMTFDVVGGMPTSASPSLSLIHI